MLNKGIYLNNKFLLANDSLLIQKGLLKKLSNLDLILNDFRSKNLHITTSDWETYYKPTLITLFSEDYVDDEGTGYYYNTFLDPASPNFSNKADWFILMFRDNNTSTRTITKTGETLRHDLGGIIYNQNNIPVNVFDTEQFWIISSKDGFGNLTVFDIVQQPLIHYLPGINYMSNLQTLNYSGNTLENKDLENYLIPSTSLKRILLDNSNINEGFIKDFSELSFPNIQEYLLQDNSYYGDTMNFGTLQLKYVIDDNDFTEIDRSTFSPTKFTSQLFLNGNIFTSSDIDFVLSFLKIYFDSNTPNRNIEVTLEGNRMGYLTDGASNSDLLAIQVVFGATAYTFTCSYNTEPANAFANTKAVFTFDDGFLTNYQNAYPLFETKGITGVFYINTGKVGDSGKMTWAQLTELYNNGHEIESHSNLHADLTTLTEQQIRDDFDLVDAAFTANSLPTPDYFAYPYGSFNATVKTVVGDYYLSARKSGSDNWFYTDVDKYEIAPIAIDMLLDDSDRLNKIKQDIDIAINRKASIIFYAHDVLPSSEMDSETIYTIQIDYLEAIIDYCVLKGVDIVTLDTLYNLLD